MRNLGFTYEHVQAVGDSGVFGELVNRDHRTRAKSYSGSPRTRTGSTTSHGARSAANTCSQCRSPSTARCASSSARRTAVSS